MRRRSSRWTPALAGWLVVCALGGGAARAEETGPCIDAPSPPRLPAGASLTPDVSALVEGAPPPGLHLGLAADEGGNGLVADPRPGALPLFDRPQPVFIAAVSAIAVGGSALNAFGEEPRYPFHYTNEGWFGADTYAGGADKASHMVSYYAVSRMMKEAYRTFGMSEDSAILLATGVSIAAGFATEIGDGTNKYGFSWQDIGADSIGAAAGYAIRKTKTEDLFGLRAGIVPAPDTGKGGLGKDYSEEIYAADLKIAGLGRRAHFNPGIAKFLLLSMTYGSKGYPYSEPDVRQRQIGIEVGINFREVLTALHVPPHRWWGVILYTLFDIVRFPYTSGGFRYDLNHHKWYGPDIGDSFPNPGSTDLRGPAAQGVRP
ncbi:MAG TPA: DUF2279 domain-containing protein [Thermoanaerobaculia bacterium]|nr:DUF2279 domain-containing protein [Thermoanaerobaculia bacterium]